MLSIKGLTGTHILLLEKSIKLLSILDSGELPGNSLYRFVQWLESILSPDDEKDLLLMEMKGGRRCISLWDERVATINYKLTST